MANLTQSLSDQIRFFGIQPSTKFGAPMKWGTDVWGNGGVNFNLPTSTNSFHSDAEFCTDAYSFKFTTNFMDMVTFIEGGIGEFLHDGSGKYLHVLPGGVTNDENSFVPTYTTSTIIKSTWTVQTVTKGSWT